MADGRTAFLGPVDDALPFFSSQGFPCPLNYNPADFFIHTLATEPGQEMESKMKNKSICDAYKMSMASRHVSEIVQANRVPNFIVQMERNPVKEFPISRPNMGKSPYKASWIAQFRAVLWRSIISVYREPAILRVKSFETIVSITYNQFLTDVPYL
jgi:hypothetical protein